MKVAVIGGGVSGLTAAFDLVRQGIDCALIESQARLGGVIRTDRVGGCLIEAGPDSFLTQKPWATELIRELGLGDELIGSNDSRRRTFILRDGRLHPMPDGLQFMAPTKIRPILQTKLLSLSAKVHMGMELFRRANGRNEDRSVADFVIDHYGSEVNEYLVQPLLAGVYGGSPESLSLNSVLPRFAEIERKTGSLSRGLLQARKRAPKTGAAPPPLFTTLRGGLQQLTDKLADEIAGEVSVVHAEALAVRRTEAGFEVKVAGDTVQADRVVVATPAYRAADLVGGLDGELAESLRKVAYSSSITAALLYRRPEFARPLDGFGFLVPRAEKRPIAACTWVNTKFDGRAPEEQPLLRAFLAGDEADRRISESDEELGRLVHGQLSELMGFEAQAEHVRVQRWPRAMAQYQVGHARLIEEIEARTADLPGLALAGGAYEGIGIPDCIRRSRRIARAITQ